MLETSRKEPVEYRPGASHLLIFLLLLFIICLSGNLSAQSNSRIDRLFGGNIGLNIKWSGGGFSGFGARSDAMGGSISTLFSDAQSISNNPAGLGFARGLSFALDWSPPLIIDPAGLTKKLGGVDIQERINDSLHETARNNSTDGFEHPGTVEEAAFQSNLNMVGGLKGAALVYGNPVFAMAAAFHQPFRIETQIATSGMEFLAAALDSRGSETQRIFGTVNSNFNLNLTMENSTIAAATRLLPNLAIGLAYDNMSAEMNFEGTLLPEGIISSAGGDTRAFNDPARVQYDSLFAVMRGDWQGNAFRLRGGVGYHPMRKISLDATFAMPLSIGVSGPFSMVHNNIRALDLGAGADEEVFDVDKLVEDNLTQTEKKVTAVQNMNLELPGSLALGFSARWSNYVASAVYTKYFDHLGYRLSYQQFDSLGVELKNGETHQGVDFQHALRLGFGVRPFMLGVGALMVETFDEKTTNGEIDSDVSERQQLLVPFLSLGGGLKFSSHFSVDYVLSLYNSSFFRITTTYRP